MMLEKASCLINEVECGRITKNPVCPKCGMDDRVVYPGLADLEAALQNARVNYWKTHAQQLQQRLRDSAKSHLDVEQAQREREAIEKRKSEEALRQAALERQELGDLRRQQAEEGRLRSEQDLHNRVKKIIAEQLSIELSNITNGMSIVGDLGADSLDVVEIAMAIEDAFFLEIPDDDVERIVTVQQVIDYVARRCKQEHHKS